MDWFSSGKRRITTFKKLPTTAPKMAEIIRRMGSVIIIKYGVKIFIGNGSYSIIFEIV
jgi:hypothetical protein